MIAASWQTIDSFLKGLGVRFGAPTPGQTTGGTHVAGSFHYQGTARDYGRTNSDVAGITKALRQLALGPDTPIAELFDSTDGVFIKNGQVIKPSDALRQDHYDHVHVALKPGASLTALTDAQQAAPAATASSSSGGGGGLLGDGIAGSIGRVAVEALLLAGGVALTGLGITRGFAKDRSAA